MKKRFLYLFLIIICSQSLSAQDNSRKLLGNWQGQQELLPQVKANLYWHFLADGNGSLDGATFLTSRASIICNFEMPFTWRLQHDSLQINYGPAACTCNPTPGRSVAAIEKMEKDIAGQFGGLTQRFAIQFLKRKLVKLGGMELKKD